MKRVTFRNETERQALLGANTGLHVVEICYEEGERGYMILSSQPPAEIRADRLERRIAQLETRIKAIEAQILT